MPKGDITARLETNKAAVIDRYRAGESTCSLGRSFDCSGGSVFLALKRWDEPIRVTKKLVPMRGQVLDLHNRGMTNAQISRELGIRSVEVCRALKAFGIEDASGRKGRRAALEKHADAVILRYQAGEGIDTIGKDYGCSGGCVARLLRSRGVEVRSVRDYSYPVDESFFDVIDTENKAFTTGFILADGANVQSAPYFTISITDRDILESMARAMRYEGPIRETPPRGYGRKPLHEITIGSRKMCDALANVGCVQSKTYIATFPTDDQVPPELHRHFIRGLNDGDGTITADSNTNRWMSRIVGTEAVCRGVSAACQRHLGFSASVHPVNKDREHITWGFSVCGHYQLKTYLDWLYKDATIFLPRKHAKYQQFLATVVD